MNAINTTDPIDPAYRLSIDLGGTKIEAILIIGTGCGGGISIDERYTLGVEQVWRYAFHKHVETPILKHQLGDSAGVIGAAWNGK